MEKAAKLQDYVDRNRVRALTTKMAQSRRKQLEKMEISEKPKAPRVPLNFTFDFDIKPYDEILTVEDLTVTAGGKTLIRDLNLNIHKSISSFVVIALLAYIKSADDSELTNTGMAEKDRQEVIITKEYIDKIKNEIRIDALKEVARMINDMNINNQSVINMSVLQQMMNNSAEKPEQESEREEEKPDAALEEMSVLFSQGGFGEE